MGKDLMLQGQREESGVLLLWGAGGGWHPQESYLTLGLRFRTPALGIFFSAPNSHRPQFLHLYKEGVHSFQSGRM